MSEITEASTGPNAAQYEYWNKVAGPRRVGWGGFVERRVRAANDLLLARSAVAPGETVLEVGCGTGAATLPLAEAVSESGRVVGIDLSEPMLAVARRHVAESGRRNISLLHADAQVYGFVPDTFDLIASRFGVMFFSDPVAAFRNLAGAVKPGGRQSRPTHPARWRSATRTTCVPSSAQPGSTASRSTARRPTSLVRPRRRRPSTLA